MAEVPKPAGPTQLTAAAAAIYTAPTGAGTWSILRSILLVNTDTSLHIATVGVFTSASDAVGRRLLDRVPVRPGETVDWSGFFPLRGGASPDLVYAFAEAASVVNVALGLVEGP